MKHGKFHDQDLERWVRRFQEIVSDPEQIEECRGRFLTAEQRRQPKSHWSTATIVKEHFQIEASGRAFRIRAELEVARVRKVDLSDKDQAIPDVTGTSFGVSEETGNLVEISVASDDGVRVGMKLDVDTTGQYRRKIAVLRVLLDESVAQVMPDYFRDQILPNDQVATRFK